MGIISKSYHWNQQPSAYWKTQTRLWELKLNFRQVNDKLSCYSRHSPQYSWHHTDNLEIIALLKAWIKSISCVISNEQDMKMLVHDQTHTFFTCYLLSVAFTDAIIVIFTPCNAFQLRLYTFFVTYFEQFRYSEIQMSYFLYYLCFFSLKDW